MNWSQDKYVEAFEFASFWHKDQKVPGSEFPYNVHLAKVAMEIIAALNVENEANGNLAIQCAILHDVLEDTNANFEMLANKFGQDVANGVAALTKNDTLPKSEKMEDSLSRILSQPKEIAMVKLADRITNLAPPPAFWTKEKRIAYLEEAQLIFDHLHFASPFLAERFLLRMREYQTCI